MTNIKIYLTTLFREKEPHTTTEDVAIVQDSYKEVHAVLIGEHFKRVDLENYDWKNTVGKEKCCYIGKVCTVYPGAY